MRHLVATINYWTKETIACTREFKGFEREPTIGKARRGGEEVQSQMAELICQLCYSSRMDPPLMQLEWQNQEGSVICGMRIMIPGCCKHKMFWLAVLPIISLSAEEKVAGGAYRT